jgi:hypothetical protein
MIFRRIATHIKDQNWTAVAIDFVIVVIGVFVGLQLQDWNDNLKEREDEYELLARLYDETQSLLTVNEKELSIIKVREKAIFDVNPVLFSQVPARTFTPWECSVVSGSHVLRRSADELPVLDEMLGTGRFDIISDANIKRSSRAYLLLRERSRAHYEEAVNEHFRLHSRFPSMIVLQRIPREPDDNGNWGGLSGDGYRWQPICDVEKMRESTAFLNEYVDNVGRLNSLTQFIKQREEHLSSLTSLLKSKQKS